MKHEIPDLGIVGKLYQWLNAKINLVDGDVHQLDVVESDLLLMVSTTLRDMSDQADAWVEDFTTIKGVDFPVPEGSIFRSAAEERAKGPRIFTRDDLFIKHGEDKPDWTRDLGEGF